MWFREKKVAEFTLEIVAIIFFIIYTENQKFFSVELFAETMLVFNFSKIHTCTHTYLSKENIFIC